MFQIILNNDSVPISAEILEKAYERGITWVVLGEKTPADIVSMAEDFCRKNGLILTVTDNVELLVEKRLHGILFGYENLEKIQQLRETHGAHPIIGVTIKNLDNVAALIPLDIDYLVLDCHNMHPEECKNFALTFKSKFTLPLVCVTSFLPKQTIEELMQAGFDGFAFSSLQ